MGKIIIWQDICTKFYMNYYPRQRYNLRKNCLDWKAIVYRCHAKWTIKIKIKFFYDFLCYKKCTNKGYHSTEVKGIIAEVNVFLGEIWNFNFKGANPPEKNIL